MRLEATRTLDGIRHYRLDVTEVDLVRADFTEFDHLLFRDVEKNAGDQGTPIADWLLALETMARRIEEAEETVVSDL